MPPVRGRHRRSDDSTPAKRARRGSGPHLCRVEPGSFGPSFLSAGHVRCRGPPSLTVLQTDTAISRYVIFRSDLYDRKPGHAHCWTGATTALQWASRIPFELRYIPSVASGQEETGTTASKNITLNSNLQSSISNELIISTRRISPTTRTSTVGSISW